MIGITLLSVILLIAAVLGLSISKDIHTWKAPEGLRADAGHLDSASESDGSGNKRVTLRVELFKAAAGGYGLFGVILDVDLRVMPNYLYKAERFAFPAHEYPARPSLYPRIGTTPC